MKLKKLTIHNIASIADAVIDFSDAPLASSDVFLICVVTDPAAGDCFFHGSYVYRDLHLSDLVCADHGKRRVLCFGAG